MARRNIVTKERCRRAVFNAVADKVNWKKPTRKLCVQKRSDAETLGSCIAFFTGGYEIKKAKCGYQVGSKGYYHYIGA